MKKLFKTHETYVALTVIALCLVIGIINPVFFSAPNIVNLFRNATVNGIMAFALMMGIIIGGIDVAFPAVAVCSMYLTTKPLFTANSPSTIPAITLSGVLNIFGVLTAASLSPSIDNSKIKNCQISGILIPSRTTINCNHSGTNSGFIIKSKNVGVTKNVINEIKNLANLKYVPVIGGK